MAGGATARPISLFFSYSHKDEALRDELGDHLVPLERAGLIEVWHDREMLPGDNVDEEIAEKLKTADVILVLVSPSFIRSSYCYDIEFENAIKRHRQGEARVVPVILRPCQWQLTPLKDLLAMPTDGKAVTQWPNHDTAFNDVADGVRRLATAVQQKGVIAAAPADAGAKPAVGQLPREFPDKLLKAEPAPVAERDLERRPDDAPPNRVIADLAVFRDVDAPWCPEMVALPPGVFLMGSPESEKDRFDDEGPQHEVAIGRRFAIGRYPVTVGEYRKFVEASGHHHEGGMYVWSGSEWKRDAAKSWRDPGFVQTDRHPVVGVSWRDATAYCEWLAKETDQPYRLPSEAEWEYAARAGTTTRYSWGDRTTEMDANFESRVGRTTEAGAHPANPWGLYDMHGNVWEWVEDVWHDSYKGAPVEGSAWTEGEGKHSSRYRGNRGGSWYNLSRYLRSANRNWNEPDYRYDYLGFRVARTLS